MSCLAPLGEARGLPDRTPIWDLRTFSGESCCAFGGLTLPCLIQDWPDGRCSHSCAVEKTVCLSLWHQSRSQSHPPRGAHIPSCRVRPQSMLHSFLSSVPTKLPQACPYAVPCQCSARLRWRPNQLAHAFILSQLAKAPDRGRVQLLYERKIVCFSCHFCLRAFAQRAGACHDKYIFEPTASGSSMKLHSLRILLAENLILEPTPLFAAFSLWYCSLISCSRAIFRHLGG